MANTQKQTTSTNILRGIVGFLTAIPETTDRQPIVSVEGMVNNLTMPCDLFRAADLLQVPASKLLAIAEWFEAGLVVHGWEVARGSDDNNLEDSFLLAVAALLSGEYGKHAAIHARLQLVAPDAHAPFEGSYRSVLVNHLYAYTVNKVAAENMLNVVQRSLYQHPLVSSTNPLRNAHYGEQTGRPSQWAHQPI